jgi:hypothetical protein
LLISVLILETNHLWKGSNPVPGNKLNEQNIEKLQLEVYLRC